MYPKFEQVYEALLLEQYDLEEQRREILTPTWYWAGINMSCLALSIALLTVNVLIAFVVVACTVASIIQRARVRKQNAQRYEAHYRTAVVAPTLQMIETCYNAQQHVLTLSYEGEQRLFDEVIDASPLRSYEAHARSGHDFIEGSYRDMPIKGSVVTMYKDVGIASEEALQDPTALLAFDGTLLRVQLPFMLTGTHRVIEGTFVITDWKSAFKKQLSSVSYQALKKKDDMLQQLTVSDITDTVFQERFKLHTNDEEEASKLFTEHVQTELLALLRMLGRHHMTLDLLFEEQWLYIVLAQNRYIAEERMHLSLDEQQVRTIYTGLVSQLRVVDACVPMMSSIHIKKTSE